MPSHQQLGAKIDEIVAEMRRLGIWESRPPPKEAMDFKKAFGADTMIFTQWLQFVFIPNVGALVQSGGKLPGSSSVGTMAIREFDGQTQLVRLESLLCEFDGMFR